MSRRSSTASDPRALHLDAFSGIAGNMMLGALLGLGLPRRVLDADLAGLGVPFKLVVTNVRRGALDALYVDVQVPQPRAPRPRLARATVSRARARAKSHGRGHPHHHDHGLPDHAHPHAHSHAPAPGEHGRSYEEIQRILSRAKLVAPARDRALAIFGALAEAEARVHGIPVERVHFHEVGAIDAIVDVAGTAVGLHRLGIERVTCSPLPLGHGSIETAHGRLPLPAPATLELLRGAPIVPAGIEWETVTPTGAAIVRTVVDEFCTLPAMRVEAIGLGAGNDRSGGLPNVLRAVLGAAGGYGADRVTVLETHVDDLNPEHFDFVMERLFAAGALDVSLMHLQMKKNRPGYAIRVIARPPERAALAGILFAETTTLGVRVGEMERMLLEREVRSVATEFGPIRVKIARDATGRVTASAEYEDCKAAALRAPAALRDVVRAAEQAALAGPAAPTGSRPVKRGPR
jgi:uncharacterized protein (TIGR00299 family) protein